MVNRTPAPVSRAVAMLLIAENVLQPGKQRKLLWRSIATCSGFSSILNNELHWFLHRRRSFLRIFATCIRKIRGRCSGCFGDDLCAGWHRYRTVFNSLKCQKNGWLNLVPMLILPLIFWLICSFSQFSIDWQEYAIATGLSVMGWLISKMILPQNFHMF